jgi:hypothetical protein
MTITFPLLSFTSSCHSAGGLLQERSSKHRVAADKRCIF